MGLSFHYNGKIKDMNLIPALVDEVQDVCKVLDWKWHLFDDADFRGICFSPRECEPVFLTFNNTVKLASPILWQYKIEPITTIATKTQFAGIETHIAVIKLLKHLKARYFSEFDMSDEGEYWETDDEVLLKKKL